MSLRSKIKYLFWPKDRTERVRRAELIFWAFIFALSQSPLPFGFLAWFALVRPLAIISRLEGKQAFGSAYFYSWFANLFTLYWVAVVTPPGMVAAVFIMSLYPALVLSAFSAIYQRKKLWGLLLLPFLWVGMEYFRSLTEISFPWTDLAYSQGYYLRLIQIVSVIGCYGLSFLIVLLNIFVWQAISRRNRLERRVSSALAFIGVLLFVYLYGYVVFPVYPESGPFKVALLQGNVDLKTKLKVETRERNFILYD
jgi:apolipoprotein N-acyltransferase